MRSLDPVFCMAYNGFVKRFILLLLAGCSCMYANSITGWDIIGDYRGSDAAVYAMQCAVHEYPNVLLANTNVCNGKITGIIKKVYKGKLNQGGNMSCHAPANLYPVQESNNKCLSEMFILCKSSTATDSGTHILEDCVVIPRNQTPLVPEVALRIALSMIIK